MASVANGSSRRQAPRLMDESVAVPRRPQPRAASADGRKRLWCSEPPKAPAMANRSPISITSRGSSRRNGWASGIAAHTPPAYSPMPVGIDPVDRSRRLSGPVARSRLDTDVGFKGGTGR
jgi:hypothetical protein